MATEFAATTDPSLPVNRARAVYAPASSSAFSFVSKIEATPENQVGLTWRKDRFTTTLHVDLQAYATRISYYDPTVDARKTFKV